MHSFFLFHGEAKESAGRHHSCETKVSDKMSGNNNNGTGSVVCGALSIPAGIFIPLLGLILGIIGIVSSKKASDPGKATTAKVLSVIGLVVSVGAWIVNIVLMNQALQNMNM